MTMLEFGVMAIVFLLGVLMGQIFYGAVGCFIALFLVRNVTALLRVSGFKHRLFFMLSDLRLWPTKDINYYRKYYL